MIYLIKGKFKESIDQINIIFPKIEDSYERMCCYNILGLAWCKEDNHEESLKNHLICMELCLESKSSPLIEAIITYNLVVESLHIGDMLKVTEYIKRAYEIAEENKANRNLIFSKILLLYQEMRGKGNLQNIKSKTSKNTLKKKALDFILRPIMGEDTNEMKTLGGLTIKAELNPRGRKIIEILSDNEKSDNKIFSLGCKIKKKRSKTEHKSKRNVNVAQRQILSKKSSQTEAVIKIQRFWRNYKRRQSYKKKKLIEISAKKIQSFYRMYQKKKEFKYIQESIRKIQANIRKYMCLKNFKIIKEKVSKIQALAKGKVIQKNYIKFIKSVEKIQALLRGYRDRKKIARWHKSARIIQKIGKIFISTLFAKRNDKFWKIVLKSVLFLISSSLFSYKDSNNNKKISLPNIREEKSSEISIENKDYAPIIKIQSVFRMYPLKKIFKIYTIATIILQRFARGYLIRRKLLRLHEAARRLQCYFKSKIHLQ